MNCISFTRVIVQAVLYEARNVQKNDINRANIEKNKERQKTLTERQKQNRHYGSIATAN